MSRVLRTSFAASSGALLSLFLLPVMGCGSDLVLPDEPQAPSSEMAIVVVGGDGQRGTVGQLLSQPLVVELTDEAGKPVVGQQVAFVPTSGEQAGRVVPAVGVTDAAGRASSRWLLGNSTGEFVVEARLVSTESTAPAASFTARAESGAPASLAAVSGDAQRGPAGAALRDPLVVRVTDQFGNAVSGVSVRWDVTRGSGTVSSPAGVTDAAGASSVEWTLGLSFGTQAVEASLDGVAGSPVQFTAVLGN